MTELALDELNKISMKISDWKRFSKKGIEVERLFGGSWYDKYGFKGTLEDLEMRIEHADDYSIKEHYYRISLHKDGRLLGKFPSGRKVWRDERKEEGRKIKEIYKSVEKRYQENRDSTLNEVRDLIKN